MRLGIVLNNTTDQVNMEPQFKIHGKERRQLKKELSLLKKFIGSFWHNFAMCDDMARIYRSDRPSRRSAECDYEHAVAKAEALERRLGEPYRLTNSC